MVVKTVFCEIKVYEMHPSAHQHLHVLVPLYCHKTLIPFVCGSSVVLFFAFLWLFQEKLIFHPDVPKGCRYPSRNPYGLRNPKECGLNYEDIYIPSTNGVILHLWLIKQPKEKFATAPTILYLQSNAGNMGSRLPIACKIYESCGTNIAMLSYRGFGNSTGHPSEKGLYDDAAVAVQYLLSQTDVDKTKLFVYGSSIGSAPAIEIVSKMPEACRGMILENPFVSIYEVLLFLIPFPRVLRYISRFMRVTMDNQSKIRAIRKPLLVITGEKDMLVPPNHSVSLLTECPTTTKHWLSVKGAGHNDVWDASASDCVDYIASFVELYTAEEKKVEDALMG